MKVLEAMLVVAAIAVPAQPNDVAIDNFKFAAPTITVAVWTMAGGVLKGTPLEASARATKMNGGLRFVQISDSHIGFDKPANTDVTATLRQAIAKIKASSEPPSFVLHTGDLTHLSKP